MALASYDPNNLTREQYATLLGLSCPIARALAAGVPSDAIREHVLAVLDRQEVKDALSRARTAPTVTIRCPVTGAECGGSACVGAVCELARGS